MKILIPVFGFAASGGGRVLSELANNWIEDGHSVTFIAFADSIDPYFPTCANIIWIDNMGRRVSEKNTNKRHIPLQYFFTRYSLKRAINSFGTDYDIVLASHSFTAFPVYYSNIKAKKFYYIQAYEPEFYAQSKFKDIFYKHASIASYKYDLLRIVNCELYLDYKEIKANMFVYPGINLKLYFAKSIVCSKPNEIFRIGCVGRIQKFKGTQLVIDAFKILRNQHKNVELFIAFGNKELSDSDGVNVVTPASDAELAAFYRSVDVIVAPGTIQLGAVHYPVLESMASGTPVITTGYSRADSQNSYIVPVNNVKAIVDSLEQIMKNPSEAIYKTNKTKELVKEFSWDIVSRKMLKYFNDKK